MQWRCLGRVFYFPKALVVLLAGVLCAGLVIGGYFLLPEADAVTVTAMPVSTVTAAADLPETTPETVFWEIYIVGAVRNPGIYTLEAGALVHDAVEAAGGLLETADPQTVNMVQELEDNLMLHILTEDQRLAQGRGSGLILTKNGKELNGGQTSSANTGGAVEKININSATKEALMTLPGIGQTRAESIIAYREEHGPFAAIEDIMLVSGIKESAYAKIKDRITT